MVSVASWCQLQELRLRLLEIAASSKSKSSTAEGAAMALSCISRFQQALGGPCVYFMRMVLAQPRSQQLLQTVLRCSSRTATDAVADVLARLRQDPKAESLDIAAVPPDVARLLVAGSDGLLHMMQAADPAQVSLATMMQVRLGCLAIGV
jgi:hypothetical protein